MIFYLKLKGSRTPLDVDESHKHVNESKEERKQRGEKAKRRERGMIVHSLVKLPMSVIGIEWIGWMFNVVQVLHD